jgi:hypothetical protein
LKVDVAFSVQIPDEITFRFADNNLSSGTEATLTSAFHFRVKSESVPKQGDATLKRSERLRARKALVIH